MPPGFLGSLNVNKGHSQYGRHLLRLNSHSPFDYSWFSTQCGGKNCNWYPTWKELDRCLLAARIHRCSIFWDSFSICILQWKGSSCQSDSGSWEIWCLLLIRLNKFLSLEACSANFQRYPDSLLELCSIINMLGCSKTLCNGKFQFGEGTYCDNRWQDPSGHDCFYIPFCQLTFELHHGTCSRNWCQAIRSCFQRGPWAQYNQGRRHICALIDLTTNVLHWHRYSVDGNMSSDPSVSDVPVTISLSQLLDTLGLGSIETRPWCQQATGHPFYRYARSLVIDFLLEQTGNLIRFIRTGILSSLQTWNILQIW